jgi:outer membrane protein assembly factor BamA
MRSNYDQSRRLTLKRLVIAAASLAAAIGFSSLCLAQTQTTLRRIEIVGLQRQSPDQVILTSGLRVGDTIDAASIDAAANKLMKSGMFRSVSYRVARNRLPTTADTLGQVRWIGNQVLASQELATAFAMRTGDPADRVKIDAGLEAVRKAYARKGYVAVQVSEFKTRNVLNNRTDYEFTVREGQQYRMGAVTVTGLTLQNAQRLKAKWALAADAVFDDSYLDNFKQTTIRPFVAELTQRTGVRSKYEVSTKPDVQKQTVDVIITFK